MLFKPPVVDELQLIKESAWWMGRALRETLRKRCSEQFRLWPAGGRPLEAAAQPAGLCAILRGVNIHPVALGQLCDALSLGESPKETTALSLECIRLVRQLCDADRS